MVLGLPLCYLGAPYALLGAPCAVLLEGPHRLLSCLLLATVQVSGEGGRGGNVC